MKKRRIPTLLVLLCFLPWLAMCTGCHGLKSVKNDDLISALENLPALPSEPPPGADDGSERFAQAVAFHRYVMGEMSAEEARTLRQVCRSRKAAGNPFCPSVARLPAPRPAPPAGAPAASGGGSQSSPPEPLAPRISGTRVTNLAALRRASVERLLGGLKGLPLESLRIVAREAGKGRPCPNNIAIAVAATLEDYLPDRISPTEPAELYARSSLCFRKGTSHDEHFLTRAGLLHYMGGNYQRAADLFAQVRPTDAYVGRAYYWLYRSHQKLGNRQKARHHLRRLWIHHPFSFHALAAALETGRPPEDIVLRKGGAPRKRSRRVPAANSVLKQVEILNGYGLISSASRLAGWLDDRYRRLEPEVRLYLAELANAHYRAARLPALFLLHQRLVSPDALRLAFPTPHTEIFRSHGFGVDPHLLLAVARKESKFDPKAVSRANAQGLLQVHPDTADRLMGGRPVDLFHPHTSITLAGFYMRGLLRRFDGNVMWAVAAYNAGHEAAESWISRFPSQDPVLQMDLITYRETRTYVGFVLNNYYWYRKLYAPREGNPLEFLSGPSLARLPRSVEEGEGVPEDNEEDSGELPPGGGEMYQSAADKLPVPPPEAEPATAATNGPASEDTPAAAPAEEDREPAETAPPLTPSPLDHAETAAP